MGRLTVYLADLAKLMGTPKQVHFAGIGEGSTVLTQRVDPGAAEAVKSRLRDGYFPGE